MKFSIVADYFKQIEDTQSRNSITTILAELFEKISSDEIAQVVYLLQGRIAPEFEKIEFNVADKMLIKAAISSLHVDKDSFIEHVKKSGDVGITVEEFKKRYQGIEQKDLSVSEVFDLLKKAAYAQGIGSQEVKIGIISQLIAQLDPLSNRYLMRIPTHTLQLGFSAQTILDAYSWMLKGDKSLKKEIEKAYHVLPDLGKIGQYLKKHGIEGLAHIEPSIFTPILMMRAERLANPEEIIEKLGECSIEPKFDGFRLQVHFKKNEVRLYSRNLEEVSHMYPDIIEGIKKEIHATDLIIEGEAIGFNPTTQAFLPFQETVQRKRKYNVSEKAKEIPLKLFAFELLYLNGKSYLSDPYSERRSQLEKLLSSHSKEHTILLAQKHMVDTADQLDAIFHESVNKGLEGIMAKKLSGIYQAGARGFNWIKYKKSYNTKLNDTIDTVVMGYDYGKGKRTDFGMGAFLVGIWNEETKLFETVSKIGTGLTDMEWRELKKRLSGKKELHEMPKEFSADKTVECDVWVNPSLVVEIRADEITRSTVHTAGRVLEKSDTGSSKIKEAGYALRFPRLERFRDDKLPYDSTSIQELKKMFDIQYKH